MKIIQTDNFDREMFDEREIVSNIDNLLGEYVCSALIKCYSGENSSVFFKLVADDHKLFEVDY